MCVLVCFPLIKHAYLFKLWTQTFLTLYLCQYLFLSSNMHIYLNCGLKSFLRYTLNKIFRCIFGEQLIDSCAHCLCYLLICPSVNMDCAPDITYRNDRYLISLEWWSHLINYVHRITWRLQYLGLVTLHPSQPELHKMNTIHLKDS